jgi:hypothetical protein
MTTGSLRASSPGEFGQQRLVSAPIVFGNTTVALGDLAVGDVVVQCWVQVTTAFNAGTTNVITLGDGTTADKYLAAADVTEGTPGVYPTGGKGPFVAETAAKTLTATYAQTGTAATTGAARVYAVITDAPA